jgi:hypothetical protein
MEQKIITSTHADGLNTKIKEMQAEGWEPMGSHQVVTTHVQNRYAGSQHMDAVHKSEYSQTMVKK